MYAVFLLKVLLQTNDNMCKYLVFSTFVAFIPVFSFAHKNPIDFLPKPYECGQLREEQYTNHENTVYSNEFPWVAKLFFNGNTRLLCLGILIHRNYVLTTASCLIYKPPIDAIQLGLCGTRNCLTVRDFEEPIIHPKYDPKEFGDVNIGLLRLKTSVPLTPYIRPLCLPMANIAEKDFEEQFLQLTGMLFLSGQRTKKFALTLSLTECRNYHSKVTENYICANSCENESRFIIGSALMDIKIKNGRPDHYYLVALQERGGNKDCTIFEPDIFLRVDRHVDWIMHIIFEQERHKTV